MDDDVKEAADRIYFDAMEFEAALEKQISYLQQENSVLHERLRKLEIALEKEREACAKVAEEYGKARYHYEAEGRGGKQDAYTAANHIAALIRGRT